jgi:uncharacterized tellurite resistance protein B-like protein
MTIRENEAHEILMEMIEAFVVDNHSMTECQREVAQRAADLLGLTDEDTDPEAA